MEDGRWKIEDGRSKIEDGRRSALEKARSAVYISDAPGPRGREPANSARAERQQRYVVSCVALSGLEYCAGSHHHDDPRAFLNYSNRRRVRGDLAKSDA